MIRRRDFIVGASCAGAWPLVGRAAPTEARLALLVGNRDYPQPFDLPPIPKNLRDLTQALAQRGFEVDSASDLPPEQANQVLRRFVDKVAASPPDAVVLFYYCGHGVQVDAKNLLINAGVSPAAKGDVIQKGSLQLLPDVVGRIPDRPQGMTMVVIDACRTTLTPGETVSDGGLNQVEAPPGYLISFSTAAGRPSIAPAVETANTFYTASLVKVLNQVSGEVSFSDLFRLVKIDVEQTMLNHPIAAIRTLAQRPFIADNARRRVLLSRAAAPAADQPAGDDVEARSWAALEASHWPTEVVRLAAELLRAFPQGAHAASAQVARTGAEEAVKALQSPEVRLYRSAFQLRPEDPPAHRVDVHRAARGDKDAAARLARAAWQPGSAPSPAQARYEGWLQFASALGNGIASYELALYYRASDQPAKAAQYESRAREQGYTPPPSLDNVRK